MATADVTKLEEIVFETSVEHVATHVPLATPEQRVDEVRRALEGQRFEPWLPLPWSTTSGWWGSSGSRT